MVGLVPLLRRRSCRPRRSSAAAALGKRFPGSWNLNVSARASGSAGSSRQARRGDRSSWASSPPAGSALLGEMLAEDAFLSPHGLRALLPRHRDQPFRLEVERVDAPVDYEPANRPPACSAATPTGADRSGSR